MLSLSYAILVTSIELKLMFSPITEVTS